jgi:heme/copper-type cytochrome/quinol oxidase subunit 3
VTGSDAGRDLPAGREETATAARGTPAPVDVAVDPRTRSGLTVFVAGPIIGVVHFFVVYLVAEAGCTGDGPGLDAFDPPVPVVLTLVATVLAAAGCTGTAVWAYRRWRSDSGGTAADELVERGPLAFMGFLLSVLGLATVLLVGAPALVLEAC